MLKNNPHEYLESEKIDKSLLSPEGKEALEIFDEALEAAEQFSDNEAIVGMAETAGKDAILIIKEGLKDSGTTTTPAKPTKSATKKDKKSHQDKFSNILNLSLANLEAQLEESKYLDHETKDRVEELVDELSKIVKDTDNSDFKTTISSIVDTFIRWEKAIAKNQELRGVTASQEELDLRKDSLVVVTRLKKAIERVAVDPKQKTPSNKGNTKKTPESKEPKAKKSAKKMLEDADKAMDHCKICRDKNKQERQRKIEAGEIPERVKHNVVTRLREGLKKLVNIMPKKARTDKLKIERTENATMIYLSELRCIWSIKDVSKIEDALKDKFEEFEEKIAA